MPVLLEKPPAYDPDYAVSLGRTKRCCICHLDHPVGDFGRNRSEPDGLQNYCRDGYSAYTRDRYTKNPNQSEDSARQFAAFYATMKGKVTHRLNGARGKARAMGLPYELDAAWLMEKMRVGVCEVTGLKFDWNRHPGKGHRTNSFAPSLDRIVPSLGYTKSNTRLVVWIYNRARGLFPDADLITMARAVVASEDAREQT